MGSDMDRRAIVEELHRAFNESNPQDETTAEEDTSFQEHSSSLVADPNLDVSVKEDDELPKLTEEEIFERLHKARREGKS
ncbi:MAG: hypothetical protein LUI02_07255 [Clostridiales bacterium]|nr:hypothetical protein [Clostridiales bacterium]